MTSISSVNSAWSSMGAHRQHAAPSPGRLMSKLDTDGSGGVDGTELQSLLDKVDEKTGAQLSASDVLKQYDENGDGQLDGGELGKAMQTIMPPPSTMAFAQQRGAGGAGQAGGDGDDLFSKVDADGDASVSKAELQALLEQMSGGTASETGVSSDDLFAQLDTDGNGALSQAEFDAGRPDNQAGFAGPGGPSGMPPPPPAGGARGSSTASTDDEDLDTNGDGVVSLSERLAGAQADAVAALFDAIDTDGDKNISSSESSAFIQALTTAFDTVSGASASSGSGSSTTADGSGTQGDGTSSPRGELGRLADLARQRYAQIAGEWGSSVGANASSALSAVA